MRGREQGPLVSAPAYRLFQLHRWPLAAYSEWSLELPDRASRISGSASTPIPGDFRAGTGNLSQVWHSLQHRLIYEPVSNCAAESPAIFTAGTEIREPRKRITLDTRLKPGRSDALQIQQCVSSAIKQSGAVATAVVGGGPESRRRACIDQALQGRLSGLHQTWI